MEIFLGILFGLLGLGLLFYVFPAIAVFLILFLGTNKPDFDERDLKGTVYEPYEELFKENIGFFKKLEMEDVYVNAYDGKKLHGRYLDGGFSKTAILIHGYRSTPYNNFAVLGRFLYEEKGFNLLFVENRATGGSGGKFVGFGLKEKYDVRSWARFVAKKPEVSEILIAGVSMGATAIAFTADRLTDKKISGVILDCGFQCPRDQIIHIGDGYKPLPGRILMPAVELLARVFLRIDIRENTTRHLNRMQVPALFIHGEKDETVPFYEGENAYRECGSGKMRYFVEDADHAMAFYADLEEGKKAVSRFLENNFDRPRFNDDEEE